jgi:hypothetical protein
VHKQKWMNKEYTQRSRSFLYVSIGAAIARMLQIDRVRFYENGIISMNLPIAAQVVGGKATRTTHPRVIAGFTQLLRLVADGPFEVETPFVWKTKAEVVQLIAQAGCQDMIADSVSCTHTWELSTTHPHCGMCSQCLDRRFAVIAANVEAHDPLAGYLVDVFTQCRTKDDHIVEDKTMYAGYLERANRVARIKDVVSFLIECPEAARVIPYLPGNPDSVAARIFDLYRRHAAEVNRVVDTVLARHATAIRQRTLPADCLVRIVGDPHIPVSVAVAPAATGVTPCATATRPREKKPRRRAERAATVDALKKALRELLLMRKSVLTQAWGQDLEPITQKFLASKIGAHESAVSRALRDGGDRELPVLWQAVNDPDQIRAFKG